MNKSSRTRKKSSTEEFADTELNRNVPGIDKLVEFAEELSATSGRVPAERPFSAPQAAREAGKQLSELMSLKLDSVSAVEKKDSGWQVVVNLIELSRIPHSTDVLGAYQVQLDAEGNIQSYHRGARYLRDQTGDDS